jgi:hypothetical protein
VRHRQEAEVATVEERKRVAVETATMVARAAKLVIAKLAAARTEVEAIAMADAVRAMVVELETLRGSSTSSSVSTDGGTDDEVKLARVAAQTGVDAPAALQAEAHVAAVPPMAAGAQTGTNAPVAGSTEITVFTGGAALPPQTGTMVTAGSRPLSGTTVPAVGGLHSPRPTMSSGPQ